MVVTGFFAQCEERETLYGFERILFASSSLNTSMEVADTADAGIVRSTGRRGNRVSSMDCLISIGCVTSYGTSIPPPPVI